MLRRALICSIRGRLSRRLARGRAISRRLRIGLLFRRTLICGRLRRIALIYRCLGARLLCTLAVG